MIFVTNCNIWSAILKNGGQDDLIDLHKCQKWIPWPRKPIFSYTTHICIYSKRKFRICPYLGAAIFKMAVKMEAKMAVWTFLELSLDFSFKYGRQGTLSLQNTLCLRCKLFSP